MGWFSTPKCPIHGIYYKIDKDGMCQMYYFCPQCRQKLREEKKAKEHVKSLEQRIAELEKRSYKTS